MSQTIFGTFPPYADEEMRIPCCGNSAGCKRRWCAQWAPKLSMPRTTPEQRSLLPEDSAARKTYPLSSGLLDYFPSALIEVARHSHLGNEKHNPGQPLHHARGKSADHLDAAVRHIIERDLTGAAWRILAALQEQLESEGAPVARGART